MSKATHKFFSRAASVGLALALVAGQAVSANAIVAGADASISQAPWQVALIDNSYSNNYNGQFCGGTIISKEWIATAAHCVDGVNSVYYTSILAGTNILSESAKTTATVQRIIIHPDWTPSTSQNDIALVKLNNPLTLQAGSIEKAAIPTSAVATGINAIISGWGSTLRYDADNDDPPSNKPSQLQIAQIQVQTNSYCGTNLFGSFYSDSMICATNTTGSKIDTCQGDSGGPLVVFNGGRYELAGITSWGYGCADVYPGFYTKVSAFSSWINRNAIPSIEPPTITELSATDIARGATVTVTGTGFSPNPRSNVVKIGTVAASVLAASENFLSFKIPAKAVIGNNSVTVTVSGNSVSENLRVFDAPKIKSITQSVSYVGGTVVINGSGFSTTAVENIVTFAGAGEPAEVVSATNQTLTVKVPDGAVSAKLNLSLYGASAVSPKVLKISVLPEISGLSSASVTRGSTLTITGAHFGALIKNNQVKVGNLTAKVVSVSGSTITLTVPAKAQLGSVLVTVTVDGLSATAPVTVTG